MDGQLFTEPLLVAIKKQLKPYCLPKPTLTNKMMFVCLFCLNLCFYLVILFLLFVVNFSLCLTFL